MVSRPAASPYLRRLSPTPPGRPPTTAKAPINHPRSCRGPSQQHRLTSSQGASDHPEGSDRPPQKLPLTTPTAPAHLLAGGQWPPRRLRSTTFRGASDHPKGPPSPQSNSLKMRLLSASSPLKYDGQACLRSSTTGSARRNRFPRLQTTASLDPVCRLRGNTSLVISIKTPLNSPHEAHRSRSRNTCGHAL